MELKEDFGWTNHAECGKLMLEEEKRFFQTEYRKELKMRYELEQLGEQMKKLKDRQGGLRDQLKVKLSKEHNNGYIFITINPKWKKDTPTSVEVSNFEKKIIKFINRNFCVEASAVLEQRGTTEKEAGRGTHAHIELKRNLNYRPSDIIKGVKNTFKNICNVNKPELLTCQIHGEDYHKDKMEYIQGIKTGEGKQEKQEIDRSFREKYNLQTIYNNAIPPSQKPQQTSE